ncbi:MAG TPA: sugar transferase [candidate division Zixibacteria bacterium]|nr:sugar transferase [candidate division Zixibacteria bacterium]
MDGSSSVAGGALAYLLASEFGKAPVRLVWRDAIVRNDVAYVMFFAIIAMSLMASRNLYQSSQIRRFWREMRAVILSFVAATFIVAGYLYLVPNVHVVRSLLVLTPFFACVGAIGWRWTARSFVIRDLREGRAARRALILGEAPAAFRFRDLVDSHPEFGYSVRGIIGERRSENVKAAYHELDAVVRSEFVDELVVASAIDDSAIRWALHYASENQIDVRILPEAIDPALRHAKVEFMGAVPTLTVRRCTISQVGRLVKRAIDVLFSASVLVFLLPLFIVLAILIKLDSPGPVFFGSDRIGRKGHSFTCWKLRTMVRDAEAMLERIQHLNERDRILFKVAKDPRVTRVGAILRKYSIDELPQFFNVLMGDMSLVGPRPPLPGEFAKYELDHLKRFQVSPGITGLWQVKARQNPSFSTYIRYDNFYVDHWSVGLDLRILSETVKIVLQGTGN